MPTLRLQGCIHAGLLKTLSIPKSLGILNLNYNNSFKIGCKFNLHKDTSQAYREVLAASPAGKPRQQKPNGRQPTLQKFWPI